MLEVSGLVKYFGGVKAVDNLSFQAAKGETVVLMGPSGCGKSTTIRMLNRLIEPDAGSISFDGSPISELSAESLRGMRKKIGFVFQHFNLIARLTAVENVMLGLVMGKIDAAAARDRAELALRRVGLEKYLCHRPGELSGGQQQRVAIARALAFEPELMLWDEPTASLDPILVQEVLVIMEELAKHRLSTMVIVTHELAFALNVADKIILMDKGKIVESGAGDQIFLNPSSGIGRKYKELLEYHMHASQSILKKTCGN